VGAIVDIDVVVVAVVVVVVVVVVMRRKRAEEGTCSCDGKQGQRSSHAPTRLNTHPRHSAQPTRPPPVPPCQLLFLLMFNSILCPLFIYTLSTIPSSQNTSTSPKVNE
jgi:hypothetical protein